MKIFLNYIVQHIRLATALNDELVVSVSRFRSSLIFFRLCFHKYLTKNCFQPENVLFAKTVSSKDIAD